MKVDQFRELKDRAQYWIAAADFDAAYQDRAAYGTDGRPLRYIGPEHHDSDNRDYVLFEGGLENLRRVKSIEQNPDKVVELFDDYLRSLSNAIALAVYRSSGGLNTEKGKTIAQYDRAIKAGNLGAASTALQKYASLIDGRKAAPLPPEVIQSIQPDVRAPTRPAEDLGPPAEPLEIPWRAIAIGAAAVGGIYLITRRKDTDGSYIEG